MIGENWCLRQTVEENRRKLMPDWWLRDHECGLWTDRRGKSIDQSPEDHIHLNVTIEPGADLLKSMTSQQRRIHQTLLVRRLCDKSFDSGWVTPTGEWYPCGWHNHDRFAEDFFEQPVAELERTHARVGKKFWAIEGGLVPKAMSDRLKRLGFVDADGNLYHQRRNS